MPTVFEALTMGLEHQRSGRLLQAESIYREILAHDSRNPDALHLLGMVAYQTGHNDAAVAYISKAIQVNGRISPFHNNLGNALQALGRLDDAIRSFEQALRLDPANFEARVNLGNALQDQRQFEPAVAHYRDVLRVAPDRPEVHNNLGNALLGLGRLDEAVACFDQALRIQPAYAEAYVNRASALKDLGRLEEAEASCREAIHRSPGMAAAHSNLAAILLQQQRLEEAEASCREAMLLKPDFCEPRCNLSAVMLQWKRFEEAEKFAREALRMDPQHAVAHHNLGAAVDEQGRDEEAVACYREALRLQPTLADAHNNLGNYFASRLSLDEALVCYENALRSKPSDVNAHLNRGLVFLLRGDFASGWQEYEWRWKKKEYYRRCFRQPLWDGGDPAGKTILLHAEQGMGDTLQFLRYVPFVRQRGARVVLECQARLIPLLEKFAGYDDLIPAGAPLPAFDAHAPLPSLPRLFHTTLETIPAEIPYLSVDPECTARWAARLATFDGFKVGVVWAGNPDNGIDRKRSMPVEHLFPLAQIPGIQTFSLQRGRTTPQGLNLVTLEDESCQITDTAAIVVNLDLLISVDTMPAHLAGALGVPVWTLLPFAPDFRWLLEREDTPWYPSMRLFRQPRPGDWGSVIKRVTEELEHAGHA